MSKKVLVIDNDPDILDIITIVLQDLGYVVIASDSENILAELLILQPDLVLLDDRLNRTKGTELCRRLKTDHTTCNIPIIIISAIHNLEQVARECGADNYIQKPFDIDFLAKMVASSLSKQA